MTFQAAATIAPKELKRVLFQDSLLLQKAMLSLNKKSKDIALSKQHRYQKVLEQLRQDQIEFSRYSTDQLFGKQRPSQGHLPAGPSRSIPQPQWAGKRIRQKKPERPPIQGPAKSSSSKRRKQTHTQEGRPPTQISTITYSISRVSVQGIHGIPRIQEEICATGQSKHTPPEPVQTKATPNCEFPWQKMEYPTQRQTSFNLTDNNITIIDSNDSSLDSNNTITFDLDLDLDSDDYLCSLIHLIVSK